MVASFFFQGCAIAMVELKDPTTYIPAATHEVGAQLDWNSSQRYFAAGSVETNPGFTQSGQPYSKPVSPLRGDLYIARDSIEIVAISYLNNIVIRAATNDQPKAYIVIGWIERITLASLLSYEFSYRHFAQWQLNINGTVPRSPP